MRFVQRTFALLLSVVIPGLLFAAEPIRLAVISVSPEIQPVADLLTAELSANPQLALLERDQVQKILREQNLSASRSQDCLKLGQILGADGLLLLEISQVDKTTNLVAQLVAVKPGVILSSVEGPWPVLDQLAWAKSLVSHVTPLFPKLTVLPRDAVAISILNLRGAARSAEVVRLEQELSHLLANRLAKEREIFVLERQRIDLLSDEKTKQGIEQSPFWSGSYLLDGVLDPDGFSPDTLQIRARLTLPGGQPRTIEASGPRKELTKVVDNLARTVLAQLNKTALAAWNPATEADQYVQQAQWALKWNSLRLAQWAADSAWALGRQDVECARLRVLAHCQAAWAPLTHAWLHEGMIYWYGAVHPEVLDELKLGLETFVSIEPYQGTNRPAWEDLGIACLDYAVSHLSRFWLATNGTAGVENQLAQVRALCRQTERMLLGTLDAPTGASYDSPIGVRVFDLGVGRAGVWLESPQEAAHQLRRLFLQEPRDALCVRFLRRTRFSPPLVCWNAQDRIASPQLWAAFMEELKSPTNSPIVQLMGLLLHHQVRPAGELSNFGDLTYGLAVTPAFEIIWRLRDELPCKYPVLLVEACEILNRQNTLTWIQMTNGIAMPTNLVPVTNCVRDFRTNFLHYYVENGTCFSPHVVQQYLRFNDFTTNHLAAIFHSVVKHSGNAPGQMPAWRDQFFKAYLDALTLCTVRPLGYVPPTDNPMGHLGYDETAMRILFRPEDEADKDMRAMLDRLPWTNRIRLSATNYFWHTKLLEFSNYLYTIYGDTNSQNIKLEATHLLLSASNMLYKLLENTNFTVAYNFGESSSPSNATPGYSKSQGTGRSGLQQYFTITTKEGTFTFGYGNSPSRSSPMAGKSRTRDTKNQGPPFLLKTNLHASLHVTQHWDAFPAVPKAKRERFLQLGTPRVRDEKAWMDIYQDLWYSEWPSFVPRTNETKQFGLVFCMDLKTGAKSHFPLPQTDRQDLFAAGPFREIRRNYDVFSNQVYLSQGDKLYTASLENTNWRALPVPMPGIMDLQVVQNRIYLSTFDTIMEFDPTTSSTFLMASTRRFPPANAVDKLGTFEKAYIFGGSSNMIYVMLKSGIWPWNRERKTWGAETVQTKWVDTIDPRLPLYPPKYLGEKSLVWGSAHYEFVMWRWDTATAPTPLLNDRWTSQAQTVSPALRLKVAIPPRQSGSSRFAPYWELPRQFGSIQGAVAENGPWVLVCNSAQLLCFNWNTTEVHIIPLAFQYQGYLSLASDYNRNDDRCFFLPSKAGIAIVSARSKILWFIPRSDLEKVLGEW